MGRDSSVGIASRHWQDGLGIEARWGGPIFSAPVHIGRGALPASYEYIKDTGSFTGLERSGHDVTTHKVKFTLEQATKAQRGSRGIALLFL